MTLWDYMYTPEPGWTPQPGQDPPAEAVVSFAERILRRLEDLPPDPTGSRIAPADTRCVLQTVGNHWGVYGAGAVGLNEAGLERAGCDPEGPGQFRYQILLDPAWLDLDFRATAAREPWLFAGEAEWAATRLRDLLDLSIPAQTVLRASLPPQPQSFGSGDRSAWPSGSMLPVPGTVGPPVEYTDDTGSLAEGFLTAGHVVPPGSPAAGRTQVDIQPAAGAVSTVDVFRSSVPGPLGSGVGIALVGAIDAAIIESGGPAFPRLGPEGAAGHLAAVDRVVSGSTCAGEVVGFAVWVATPASAWRDCYLVAAPNGDFSVPGHSGAAVTKGNEIIGIVLGAAAAVPGCGSALSYVQDIAAITSEFNCSVIP
jgi:hypothetical protein